MLLFMEADIPPAAPTIIPIRPPIHPARTAQAIPIAATLPAITRIARTIPPAATDLPIPTLIAAVTQAQTLTVRIIRPATMLLRTAIRIAAIIQAQALTAPTIPLAAMAAQPIPTARTPPTSPASYQALAAVTNHLLFYRGSPSFEK